MISLLGEYRNASWHFWFTSMPLMIVIWLILMASCLKSAPLPFPKQTTNTYITPGGYTLHLASDGTASYGREYHPGISKHDARWRVEGSYIFVERTDDSGLWFIKGMLRRKP